jgi:hypothetical protein
MMRSSSQTFRGVGRMVAGMLMVNDKFETLSSEAVVAYVSRRKVAGSSPYEVGFFN